MSWLKREPPPVPPPRATPEDRSYGDPLALRHRGELARGDWAGAARLLASAREWDRRFFYVDCFGSWPGRPAFLDAWCDAEAQRPEPFLVRGTHDIRWAWQARGSGWGATVTEDGARLFGERLQMALADLRRAAELDPADPTPWAQLVIVCRGLGGEKRDAQEIFGEAVRRDPGHRPAHAQTLTYLCAKWYGSHAEMFDFARGVAHVAPHGSPLYALLPTAHVERALMAVHDGETRSFDTYFADADVRDEVLAAYDRSVGHRDYRPNKLAFLDWNDFGFCLGLMNERDLARRCFDHMGERITEMPWSYLDADPRAALAKMRRSLGI